MYVSSTAAGKPVAITGAADALRQPHERGRAAVLDEVQPVFGEQLPRPVVPARGQRVPHRVGDEAVAAEPLGRPRMGGLGAA
ncbi:MAG: hypothetical protein ACRDQ7_19650, partial [Haloechinothrix sp.]